MLIKSEAESYQLGIHLPVDWAKYDSDFCFIYSSRSDPALEVTVTVEIRRDQRAVVQLRSSKGRVAVFSTLDDLAGFINPDGLGGPDMTLKKIELLFKATSYPIESKS